jgi:hypothetical protein
LPESWFSLSRVDQAEALEVAAGRTGRPAHLLEKDIWVVWALSAIYDSTLADKLTFKGGTSLSKVYKIISRFSEDIDLTYDIRELVPDLLQNGNPLPISASQEKKITSAVRTRLPQWIAGSIKPILQNALIRSNAEAELRVDGKSSEKLIIDYRAVKTGTGYAAASIQLEFGARATGEPNSRHRVDCDITPAIEGVEFPVAAPLVMAAERTFWEKATAAHVYSLQCRLRGERYSRRWYDLAAMAKTGLAAHAASDRHLAKAVAEHKSIFFVEKDARGSKVDYFNAVTGGLQLVPEGTALAALENDYTAMLGDGLLALDQPSFHEIMEKCLAVQDEVNVMM